MKIAIDLEGTLTAVCGEFSCERANKLSRYFLPHGLRRWAHKLLRELRHAGHHLTLYTAHHHNKKAFRLWCVPIHQIITIDQCTRRESGKEPQVTWPSVEELDRLVDDNPSHMMKC